MTQRLIMQNHIPVLLQEVVDIFSPSIDECLGIAKNGGKYPVIIDCTLGLGGHSLALLRRFSELEIIAIDKDINAINIAKDRANKAGFYKKIHILQAPFSRGVAEAFMLAKTLDKRIVGILADIGVSYMQLSDDGRGFSFGSGTLDMRMDLSQHKDAKYVLNQYSEFELGRVLREYGEIKEYKKMARLIREHTKSSGGFCSGKDFSEFLRVHFPKPSKIHPATLAFQAVRMEVNNELGELESLLNTIQDAFSDSLIDRARVAIISFHSLEDRVIKERFKRWARACVCDTNAMKCECGGDNAKGIILTKKPIIPSPQETKQNPRARSAKLRAFECK